MKKITTVLCLVLSFCLVGCGNATTKSSTGGNSGGIFSKDTPAFTNPEDQKVCEEQNKMFGKAWDSQVTITNPAFIEQRLAVAIDTSGFDFVAMTKFQEITDEKYGTFMMYKSARIYDESTTGIEPDGMPYILNGAYGSTSLQEAIKTRGFVSKELTPIFKENVGDGIDGYVFRDEISMRHCLLVAPKNPTGGSVKCLEICFGVYGSLEPSEIDEFVKRIKVIKI